MDRMDFSRQVKEIERFKELSEFVNLIINISNLQHKNLPNKDKEELIEDIITSAYFGRKLGIKREKNSVKKSLFEFDKIAYSTLRRIDEVEELADKWEIGLNRISEILDQFCEKYSLDKLLLSETLIQINNYTVLDLCE